MRELLSYLRREPNVAIPFCLFLLIASILLVSHTSKDDKSTQLVEKIFLPFSIFCNGISLYPFFYWSLNSFIRYPPDYILNILKIFTFLSVGVLVIKEVRIFLKHRFLVFLAGSVFRNPFFWCLLLLCLISSFRSVNPALSLRAGIFLLGLHIFALYFSARYSWTDLAFAVVISMTAIGIINSFYYDGSPLRGIAGTKNNFGNFMALNTAMLWLLLNGRGTQYKLIYVIILGITILLLLASQSIAALFTAIILVGTISTLKYLKDSQSKGYKKSILLTLISSTFVVSTGLIVLKNIEIILASTGRDLTFTGRVPLWGVLWQAVRQKFFLGYGIYGFWPTRTQEFWVSPSVGFVQSLGWNPPHAHLGFLDVWIELGLVGLLLLIGCLCVGLVQSIKYFLSCNHIASLIPFTLIVYAILTNLSESRMLQPTTSWILLTLTLIKLSVKAI